MSTPPRFRRLESIFGCALGDVDEASIAKLIDVSEADDLEFKRDLYARGTQAKQDELAKDIAALANHRGGVVVLGVDAPKPAGVCTATAGVALSDNEETRMYQLAADRLAPVAEWRLLTVRSAADAERGWYLFIVPPSTLGPHAVRVGGGQDASWRYPVRDGSTTRYLSESEIAGRYRDRFRLAADQTERLGNIHGDALADVDDRRRVFLAVSMLPTRPGAVRLTRDTPRQIATSYGERPLFRFTTSWFYGVGGQPSIGPGRAELRHAPDDGGGSFGVAHFGTDGACSIVTPVGNTAGTAGVGVGAPHEVVDELLLHEVVDALTTASWYASSFAATSGDALVRLEVCTDERKGSIVLVRAGAGAPGRRWSEREARQPLVVDTMIDVDEFVGADWPTRLQAVAFLTQRMYQSLGIASCPQLTDDGRVRYRQFGHSWRQVQEQAPHYGIELAEDMP